MKPINTYPIYVDFNHTFPDGTFGLTLGEKISTLDGTEVKLSNGQTLWITDCDVETVGVVKLRGKLWVVEPIEKFKNVTKDASYHGSNLSELQNP